MSCEKCEEAQEKGNAYYFRWKNANIAVLGCREHVKEIFDVLRKAQERR